MLCAVDVAPAAVAVVVACIPDMSILATFQTKELCVLNIFDIEIQNSFPWILQLLLRKFVLLLSPWAMPVNLRTLF
jgi:hypothetical protein